ncbi:MAG: membrane lipoprotein lipid attachment site-containing protein [Candidatus Gracilibacteria bacterium]|nr:membrane lipoprotein lipid attachment site-containing protein [Candidatus Gracilibacteria bacterium]
MKKIISAILLVSLLSACQMTQVIETEDPAQGSGSTVESKITSIEEKTADWLTYGDEKSKLTFLYPPDWDLTVNEDTMRVSAFFGKGEEIGFTIAQLPTPHTKLTVLAKTEAGEEWSYNKYLSKGKYFYNVFKDFNAAMGRTYMTGTVYYSHIGSPSSQNENTPAYQVDFDMNALDIELTEPKAILMEATYKNFWYILHTMHLN